MIENPFVFGKVVLGDRFCDREKEIEQIKKLVQSKQHIVIISPRRYGKTSLVMNSLERSRISYIYADCSLLDGEADLITALINDYAKKLDNIAILEKFLKRFELSFSVSVNPVSVTIDQIRVDTLKDLLTEIGKNYVIVFDEFQDIYEKNKKMINKIRSIVQFLEKSVIMLGSKRHILNNMFLTPRGIFYNFGYALHLEKIGKEEFKAFIQHWFRKNNIKLGEEELNKILDVSECHPFFTQYLCHFLFEKRLSGGKVTLEQVKDDIFSTNSVFYEETYRSLPTTQRKALLLLSEGRKDVYASILLKKHGFNSSQALQKALSSLIKKEIVDKNGHFYVIDIFFRDWLYQTVLNQKV